jgi:hypothetical protein
MLVAGEVHDGDRLTGDIAGEELAFRVERGARGEGGADVPGDAGEETRERLTPAADG